jgi:hypothetical protein
MVAVNQFGVNCRMISRSPDWGTAQDGSISAGVEREEDIVGALSVDEMGQDSLLAFDLSNRLFLPF